MKFSGGLKYCVIVTITFLSVVSFAPVSRADIHVFAHAPNRWLRDVTLQGLMEGGIMANLARPASGINFGDFLADHANQAQLNQVSLTLSRALDDAVQKYQIGFVIQGLYGSDARYYHLLGVSDHMTSDRYQLIPAQAHLDVHLPWVTPHGVDLNLGILQAPMGVEVLDPSARPFYTLAYTSQYSVPFEHLGAMAHWHVTSDLDIHFGIDTGNQSTWGRNASNTSMAGYLGFTLAGLAHGKMTINGLSRLGPEDSVNALGIRADSAQRYWNDLSVRYDVNDRLSLTGELNFLHDVGLRAEAYSFVSFLSYKISPNLSLNYRGEIYRDNGGAFVVSFLNNRAYMNAFLNNYAPAETAPPTTYGALTLGLTYRPPVLKNLRVFALRPEIRFDRSLNGTSPFNAGRNAGMFTFGGDAMIGF
ncbi:porin [Candidatus Kirkpatrickella diaphorinae]|uniref:Porin n=1 Tax=Candidatus Kirkpatrickella diaphorinae TaxID=2984322 RepID=A0ABY6GJU8_9PROT|nr:outer membrane beta-barrel protein [Candidatus Kirkpatrickella diaphorinae]UYH51085.1 porin [Candidatus Kirkpatrickella diaphorinae]